MLLGIFEKLNGHVSYGPGPGTQTAGLEKRRSGLGLLTGFMAHTGTAGIADNDSAKDSNILQPAASEACLRIARPYRKESEDC
jgi:hypothetical protein